MINSVDEHVAGEEYDLDQETGERYVLLGYADGVIASEWSDEEKAALEHGRQEVSLGG
jgi:hypothetical protein